MTWPFENDTSAVVKRISNRSISANRKTMNEQIPKSIQTFL